MSDHQLRSHTTMRLNAPPLPPEPEDTVRLGLAEPPDPHSTVCLSLANADLQGRPDAATRRPAPQAYLPPPSQQRPDSDYESATFLDPQVWPTTVDSTALSAPAPPMGTPLPGAEPSARAGALEELQRFGPGVPPQAAVVWHGTTPVRQTNRLKRWWRRFLPLILLAVLVWLIWDHYGRPLEVTGVSVHTDNSQGPSCGGTAVVTGTIRTEGGAGIVRYRWKRSDGSDSGVLSQPVGSGNQSTDVAMRWTFQGHGAMQATATLEILGPGGGTSSVAFPYSCS